MMLNPPTPIHYLDEDILLRLVLAAVIGLVLGIDREMKDKAAGLRTHGLICFASAFVTVAAIALYYQIGGQQSRLDPLRVIESSATFMGIIAAGLIVFSKGQVRNLTTAAHIWLATVIGIACGAGLYPLVAIGSVVAIAMLTGLRLLERRWSREDSR